MKTLTLVAFLSLPVCAQTLVVVDRSSVTAEAKDFTQAFANHLAEEVSMGHVFDQVVRDFAHTPNTSYAKKYRKLTYLDGASKSIAGANILEVNLSSDCVHGVGHTIALATLGIPVLLATPDCHLRLTWISPAGVMRSHAFYSPHALPAISPLADVVEKGVSQ